MAADQRSIGVLISGRGSNLQALIDASARGELGATIRLVVSNKPGVEGLARAERAGIETAVVSHRDFRDRPAFDAVVADRLRAAGVHLVCLAGFMRLLGSGFCEAFPDAILNIHPSLLPAFPGTDAQRQALQHGVRVTGATVHLVTPQLDAGPIVEQRAVPVLDSDTEESLSARILEVEHQIYPLAVRRLAREKWRVEGRRVVFSK